MLDLWERLDHKQRLLDGFDMDAELLLNDAADYFASELPKKVDQRAWQHLLIYCSTSMLIRTLFWRSIKRFTRRWRN